MWRSGARPDLGWGRPIAAVLGGLILPALPAGLLLWWLQLDVQFVTTAASTGLRFVWFVAACLMATPLVAWIAVPVAVPVVRVAAKRGWAGPASIVALALIIGLPAAHFVLNGDLTREAPEMIPYLAAALALQALCGWLFLRDGRQKEKRSRAGKTLSL